MKLNIFPPRRRTDSAAYLDGELTDRERARFEGRLADDPRLRDEVEGVREVRDLIASLSPEPAPRSFALRPEMVAAAPSPAPSRQAGLVSRFAFATAAAGMLVAAVATVSVGGGDGTSEQLAAADHGGSERSAAPASAAGAEDGGGDTGAAPPVSDGGNTDTSLPAGGKVGDGDAAPALELSADQSPASDDGSRSWRTVQVLGMVAAFMAAVVGIVARVRQRGGWRSDAR